MFYPILNLLAFVSLKETSKMAIRLHQLLTPPAPSELAANEKWQLLILLPR